MSRNNDYTAGNLLDFSYRQSYYKLVGIDLSRQTNTNIPEQTNFRGNLDENNVAAMFFIAKKQQKNYLKIFFKFINCFRMI